MEFQIVRGLPRDAQPLVSFAMKRLAARGSRVGLTGWAGVDASCLLAGLDCGVNTVRKIPAMLLPLTEFSRSLLGLQVLRFLVALFPAASVLL